VDEGQQKGGHCSDAPGARGNTKACYLKRVPSGHEANTHDCITGCPHINDRMSCVPDRGEFQFFLGGGLRVN
jgi:hypothetical protein